jgi:2-oxo-3-(phosphooxy)propyl 3-oxoalkanoate synthase
VTMLDFSHTVPRRLTHRATIAEVFLTSAVRVDDDTVDVGAQVPRFHAFHSDVAHQPQAMYDPLLFAEMCRQACMFVAHEFEGAPVGHKFVLRTFGLRVEDETALTVRRTPSEAVVRCQQLERFERRGEVTGLQTSYRVAIDGVEAFTGAASYSWLPKARWDLMRTRGRSELGLPADISPLPTAPRIATDHVGRLNPYNVAIGALREDGARGFRAPVVVDLSHPVMFDHPLDHVPGMLQMEVIRQAGIAGAERADGVAPAAVGLRSIELRCDSFGELDLPTEVACRLEPPVDAAVDRSRLHASCGLWQHDRLLAEADASFVCPPAAEPGRIARRVARLLSA